MDELHTNRTILRRFRKTDLPNMIRLESDPDVMRFTPSRVPLSEEIISERLISQIEKQKNFAPLGIWAAELKESSEFLGWFMLLETEFDVPELGFMIVKEQWGNGFASEIAKKLIEFALHTLGYPGVSAVTDADNPKSIHLLQKLGFSKSGSKIRFDKVLNRQCELFIFSLSISNAGSKSTSALELK